MPIIPIIERMLPSPTPKKIVPVINENRNEPINKINVAHKMLTTFEK